MRQQSWRSTGLSGRRRAAWLAGLLAFCGPVAAAWGQGAAPPAAAPDALSADAEALLRHSSQVLAAAKSMTLDVATLREVRLEDGRIVTLSSSSALAMRRPNGMRAEIRGEATLSDIIYDGTRVVVHAVAQNAYAEEPAPNRIDELLPILQDKMGLPIDVGDLFVTDPYSKLAADTSGEVVSAVSVDGVPAWHMVLRSGDVNWEYWVRQDGTALPIMASVIRDGLRTLYRFDDWRLDPVLDANLFQYKPGPGVIRVPFVFRKEGS